MIVWGKFYFLPTHACFRHQSRRLKLEQMELSLNNSRRFARFIGPKDYRLEHLTITGIVHSSVCVNEMCKIYIFDQTHFVFM